MKRIILMLAATVVLLNAKIITVPADHAKIQLAINAAVHGDTVVVYPGTYYENINFKGKNIVVTSRFYENNNTQFILSTIINGSQPAHPDTASCVLFITGEDSTAILQGFTITGGTGTKWKDEHSSGSYVEGGGILTAFTAPRIQHNIIIKNTAIRHGSGIAGAGGGAIRSGDGNPSILHNVIVFNKGSYGGAIVLNWCGAIVRNNIICNNSGGEDYGGGGLWINNSGPSGKYIENNTIMYNSSALDGGGILIYQGNSTVTRNNIIWGNTAATAGPQIGIRSGSLSVTYSNVQNGWSGTGNINTDPLFDDTSYVLKSGSPCVDSGDSSETFNDLADQSNPNLAKYPSRGFLRNDMGAYGGPESEHFSAFAYPNLSASMDAIDFGYHLPKDSAGVSGSFSLFNSGSKQLKIDSVQFTTTTAFSVDFIKPTSINVNSSVMAQVIWKPKEQIRYNDTMLVYHNSTYITTPSRIVVRGNAIPTPLMSVDLNEHNFGSLDINTPQKDTTLYVYNHGTGSDSIFISINPQGVNPATALQVEPKQFTLQAGDSQAVTFTFYPKQIVKTFLGIYTPKLQFKSFWGDDTATKEKIMRFKLTGTLGVSKDVLAAEHFSLSQNYPNPFNPVTTIAFSIPVQSMVKLSVYDLLGREIGILVNEELLSGTYRVPFDASHLSSGVYIYTLRAGAFISSKKLTVTK